MTRARPPATAFGPDELDRLFELVLVNDVVDPTAALPARITLDHDPVLLGQSFAISRHLWDSVDQDALAALIRKLGQAGDLHADDRLLFKHMRAKLKLYRFACALRDRRHRYPPMLDHLTTALGHLQDAYKTGQRRRVARKALVARALLWPVSRAWTRWEGTHLRPESPAGYRAYVAAEVARLRTMLTHPGVTGAEFHDGRKIVSRQNAFYTTASILRPDAEYRAMFAALATINGLMGAFHDELVERRVAGEQDYHRARFPLPQDIRARLQAYADRHAEAERL